MDSSIHLLERRERRGRRIAALAFIGVIVLLAAAFVGLFGFLEANASFGTIEDLEAAYICDPDDYVLELPAVGRLSEIYTSDGVLLGKLAERNSQPTPIEEIPEIVRWAVISAEDGDFYTHRGIDFKAIARAAILNYQTGNLTGGSTITQQIVKKNFLTDERTIERKICEAVVAAQLEETYTKDQILEFYMNAQYFGENAYGVKAAAQEYFGKALNELTIAEAAAMVVPIRNPSLYDMRDNTATVLARRDAIIDQMALNGFISTTAAQMAKIQPLVPQPHRDFEELAPQVIIAAREEILRDPKYGLGETYSERKRALFGCPASDEECAGGGGLKITVTVDFQLQEEANRILRSWFHDANGPTGAIAMIDNRNGALRVMASGLEFGEDLAAGQRPYDLAREGRRQAGSAFKPFALAAALENGSRSGDPITLGSYWDYTSPQKVQCESICSGNSDIWTVYNAGGSNEGGIRTLEQATYLSINTVYAQISQAVGPDQIVEMANRLGVESPLNSVLSISLGTQSVSPLEMASAYSTLANYGERVQSYLIERIEDRQGNLIYEHTVETEQVLDEALTAAIISTLEKVVAQGTATRANIGRPQAGKTGTAQNYRDVWFMGFVPQYTTAVWVGYADAQVEMVDFTVYNDAAGEEQEFRRAFGGTLAAPIWKQFMLFATKDLPVEHFPDEPAGTNIYRRTPNTKVPNLVGLADEIEIANITYKAGLNLEIANMASSKPRGTVLEQTPEAESTVPQGRTVTTWISTGDPGLMPDLVGLRIARIEPRLTRFNEETGLQVTWIIKFLPIEDPSDRNRILQSNPRPNRELSHQQQITFFVGEPTFDP